MVLIIVGVFLVDQYSSVFLLYQKQNSLLGPTFTPLPNISNLKLPSIIIIYYSLNMIPYLSSCGLSTMFSDIFKSFLYSGIQLRLYAFERYYVSMHLN